jgi:hypothetical protein
MMSTDCTFVWFHLSTHLCRSSETWHSLETSLKKGQGAAGIVEVGYFRPWILFQHNSMAFEEAAFSKD